MKTRRITVPLQTGPLEDTSAIWDEPDSRSDRSTVLLANGAGFDMQAPFMQSVAHGLVQRGFSVLRFNYPYKERQVRGEKQRPPDRQPILEETHLALARLARELADGRRLLLAGKSLGARLASHLAAKDVPCDGLVYLGYPLHAPGKPGLARAEHFAAIVQPSLFLQGTRDALCDLELLGEALLRYGGVVSLELIEGADHGFHVPKKSGKSDAEVLQGLLDRTLTWERETFPENRP